MIERVEVDEKTLVRLVAALNKEADGKELNRELARNLAAAVRPAAEAAKVAILSMSSTGQTHGVSLRAAVASRVSVEVRPSAGRVAIRAGKTGMPRRFANAPKRLNGRHGWRHKVFGSDTWVKQRGKPGWFDDTISRRKAAAKRAAQRAMDGMAERIANRTRG